jgi:hypothetical protein
MAKTIAKNTRPRSAVSSVVSSGFELVPKRKSRGKLATERDFAKVDFKPWTRDKGMGPTELIPKDQQLADCGVACRIAYAIMLMPRDELIATHGKADHKIVDKMMGSIKENAEWLKGVVRMLDLAYLRVLASASAYNQAGGKFPGVHDMRRKDRKPRRAA